MNVCKQILRALAVLTATLWLTACHTSKRTAEGVGGAGKTALLMKQLEANRLTCTSVTAKMNFGVEAGERNVSVGGSLKMTRDEVIQLSLVAFGFAEVGRLELTPDYVLVVDRMGRRYVKEAYADFGFLREAGIDFYALQALFWNELFVPGRRGAVALNDFRVTESGQTVVLEARDTRHLAIRFVTGLAQGLIRQTNVSLPERLNGPQLNWKYADFETVDGKQFPGAMQISVDGVKQKFVATISLNGLKETSKRHGRTEINTSRYERISAEAIFNRLLKP